MANNNAFLLFHRFCAHGHVFPSSSYLLGVPMPFIHYNRYDSVTVMFSGIVGFAKYCAENSDAEGAMKIVTMLNELYTSFDALTDPNRNPNIYKVRKAV